jgi:hypothetical protein
MNHQGKWFAYATGCAAIAFGVVACDRMLATDAYTALQITQVQVLTGGDCSVPGTKTSLFRDQGVLDLDLPDGSTPPYELPVHVANNLDSAGGSAATEMNNITLNHFTIELSAPGISWSANCPTTFDTAPVTITIAPGGSVGSSMNIITSNHSQCLQPQIPAAGLSVTAKIWAKGRHGGTSISSAPYIYSVTVCKGCLQVDYTDPALVSYRYPANTPMCASLVGSNPYSGDPCFPPGQDETIFCCGITQTVGSSTRDVALCPGVFTGTTSTATSTSTDTATGP